MDGSDLNRIEQDLERRRAEIDGTLRAIEDRLSVRAVSDNAWHYVQDSLVGEYGENLRHTVAGNPVPITLLGVSLAWLMLGGQRASAGAGLAAGAETTGEGIAAGARAARHTAQEAAHGVRAGGAALGHSAQSALYQARRASENYGRLIQDHPLATGIMGLAVGAAVAAMLPGTEAEDRTMGEARDRLAEQAAETGEQVAAGAQATAKAGIEAAQEEAQRQSGTGGGK